MQTRKRERSREARSRSSTSIHRTTPGCGGWRARRSPLGHRTAAPARATVVDDVLDTAAERGSMELIDELAFPVPFQVISDLLAMPTERAAELRQWSQHLTASLEPTANDDDLDRAEAAIAQFGPYLVEIIEQRRKNLGDDLLSALILAEESGDRMSTDELLTFVLLLYVADTRPPSTDRQRNPGAAASSRSNSRCGAIRERSTRPRSTSCCATTGQCSSPCASRSCPFTTPLPTETSRWNRGPW